MSWAKATNGSLSRCSQDTMMITNPPSIWKEIVDLPNTNKLVLDFFSSMGIFVISTTAALMAWDRVVVEWQCGQSKI